MSFLSRSASSRALCFVFLAASAASQLKQRYATEGAEAVPMTSQEFTKYIHDEVTRWRLVVQDAGLKLE